MRRSENVVGGHVVGRPFARHHSVRGLRNAAQHVTKFNLTQTKTTAYVSELLSETGEPPQVRLTAPVLMKRMTNIREALGGAAC